MTKKWTSEAERHAFFLSKKVDRAIRDYEMIAEGDRILVGVSGGKDSLSLLRLLVYRIRFSPAKYSLVVGHVRGDARGPGCEMPDTLVRWIEGEGVPLMERDLILPEGEKLPMNCERCGRNRRRTLFEIADEHGCNKLALGHHLEDFAHTALMNLFSSGKLETMAPKRVYFGGRFTLIRPLLYLREHELVRFARSCALPVLPSDCPVAATSDREAARNLMHSVSRDFRSASVNIVKAALRNQPRVDEAE